MKIQAFNVIESVPELNAPHALAVIQPLMDMSKAGSLTLSSIESSLASEELARLALPGSFFDLTRYGPTIFKKDGNSEIHIPNAIISYGRKSGDHDFLFLRLLEPHMQAEAYVDSVVELLKTFGVKRYCLVGSVYDMVPYTRPLSVSGSASNPTLQKELAAANVNPFDYEGPTTILSLIERKAFQLGMETCSIIVHLPNYIMMEEDYRGEKRLMEVLSSLYNFTMPKADIEKANQQEEQIKSVAEQIMQQEPRYKQMLEKLEENYDSRIKTEKAETRLSPEVEKFLLDLEKRFTQE